MILGLAWWLIWIPLAVAVGIDAVVDPTALWVSVSIGVVGLALSLFAAWRFLTSKEHAAERWKDALAGKSLHAAYLAIDEIIGAGVH